MKIKLIAPHLSFASLVLRPLLSPLRVGHEFDFLLLHLHMLNILTIIIVIKSIQVILNVEVPRLSQCNSLVNIRRLHAVDYRLLQPRVVRQLVVGPRLQPLVSLPSPLVLNE